MRTYEAVLMFPPDAPEAQKSQEKRIEDALKKLHGKAAQKTEWGKKHLGYPVRKFKEANISIWDFELDPAKITEFRRFLQLEESILKFFITIKQTFNAEPAKPQRAPRASSGPRPGSTSKPRSTAPAK